MASYAIPQNETVRLAFLGCGQVTRKHSKTLAALGSQVACYYASRDEARAEQYQQEFKGQGAYASYEEAIHSAEIDAVFVVTPPANHLELTLAALAAGKHVFVEKPPFLNVSDFDVVVEQQLKTKRQVFVAENYFYKPMAAKLRQILAQGLIGDVLFIHVNATKLQKTGDWQDSPELCGGGALFEGGIHWINFLANLGLEPKTLVAMQPKKKTDLERSTMVAIEYAEGAVATLLYSWEVPVLLKGLRICQILGREGCITFESNGIFIFVRGKSRQFVGPNIRDISGNRAMFRDFFRALRAGEAPHFNMALARRDIALIEEAYGMIGDS